MDAAVSAGASERLNVAVLMLVKSPIVPGKPAFRQSFVRWRFPYLRSETRRAQPAEAAPQKGKPNYAVTLTLQPEELQSGMNLEMRPGKHRDGMKLVDRKVQ
jgi:hypothetical protein